MRMGGIRLKETLKLLKLFCVYFKNGQEIKGRKGIIVELIRVVMIWIRNVFIGLNKLIDRKVGME